jgi:membrane-bound lytic murein transglycosylase F
MKKVGTIIFTLVLFALFGVQCTFFEREKVVVNYWENPVALDLDEIVKRGYIRAIVDNSSTSYYIYRGRRMGYEFEMLRNLSNKLGVRLHLIVKSDLHEAFYLLNTGKADIIAMNLEVNEEREQFAAFSEPLGQMGTVLLQRKNQQPIRSVEDLEGKTVTIRQDAVYKTQLLKLQEEHGVSFDIVEERGDKEYFVEKLLKGDIGYSVIDRVAGLVNATYFEDLDVDFEVSGKSDVAWAVRKNAPELQSAINDWVAHNKSSGYINTLYAKYFQNSKNSYFRSNSPFSSVAGNRISQFDELIKKGADQLGWDWRLLASLVYKESKFDTSATSYAGAVGLLQLMPVTLERFGVDNPNDPVESLMGGVSYLKYLDKFWKERVPESNERIKFILASYNIGHGHLEDAWRLALKFGKNSQTWENVAHFLMLKTDPEIYNDPVVKSGYAKGHLAVTYVEDVLILYDSYRVLVQP